ncbi:MAG: TIGR02302 family protein, partial [Rhodospirillales bacterium]|nr:TIGR02302 family protein [Rhodospirillales bacterium]
MDSRPERPETSHDGTPPRLARRLMLARLALAWEGLWPAFVPALAVAGLFLVVALFDLLPLLPAWLHALTLAGFAGALVYALYRTRCVWRLPDEDAGRRRLERASGTPHRPLTALRDRIAGGDNDPMATALWQAHRTRMRAALARVRVGWPAPGVPRRDPFAFRAALVLLLVAGAAVAGAQAWTRVVRAGSPGIASGVAPGLLDLWITPPVYTGLPPLLPRMEAGAPATIRVPVGSALIAQVTGGRGMPKLVVGEQPAAFAAVDAKAWRVGATVNHGRRLTVEQDGKPLGAWALEVIPDTAPVVEFPAAPARTRRAALRLEYEAHDDYGVVSVAATIRRATAPEGVANDPIEIALPLPGQHVKEAKGSAYHDLTAHPWAGLPVLIRLKAVDALDQVGWSEDFAAVLPERVFQHPVARAIVEQRKALVADPATRNVVSRALIAIASLPAQYYDDVVVYLSLKTASVRLLRDSSAAATDAIQGLLWDTALRIEEGGLSLAERELRAIQQKLQDALANNASDAEIERLMQELQQAIDRYLQAMLDQARRNPADLQRQPPDPNAARIDRTDLQKMLDRARELARTGAREAARDLLARLQDMLENLRAAQAQPGQQQGGGEGQQMLRGLQDMIQRQQGLLDRTFRRAQQGRPGQPGRNGTPQPGQRGEGAPQAGEGEGDGDGPAQEALRRALGEMMRQLGEMMGDIPGALGRA